ncbi:hypothetical protein [Streptomyces spectabilis]|uniref:Uncharacterized protein n=1 Tax=Streptomyces spectabilis TaxID=68270 RepID=A0A5P2X5W5_STRST|nr:hypothetical protein [Streptomyces spectabilis]MBB5108253.1 hypothetical protein [Streptomyces spectabilis]MCI3901014.1 hypothetical protein [Streptomyces spectabilis]QEV58515.1 hypothetical protein CP982_07175 [Streptomyces spectabilis]GGV45483.1 hypothetical protein GCM10010245_71140 [Streptomyces spectabilis]
MPTPEERRKQHRHRHKQRVLRGISDELWGSFAAAIPADSDRSAEVRQFIEWYVRRPGAELPKRAEAGPDDEIT